jgi:hypothetical protein
MALAAVAPVEKLAVGVVVPAAGPPSVNTELLAVEVSSKEIKPPLRMMVPFAALELSRKVIDPPFVIRMALPALDVSLKIV